MSDIAKKGKTEALLGKKKLVSRKFKVPTKIVPKSFEATVQEKQTKSFVARRKVRIDEERSTAGAKRQQLRDITYPHRQQQVTNPLFVASLLAKPLAGTPSARTASEGDVRRGREWR